MRARRRHTFRLAASAKAGRQFRSARRAAASRGRGPRQWPLLGSFPADGRLLVGQFEFFSHVGLGRCSQEPLRELAGSEQDFGRTGSGPAGRNRKPQAARPQRRKPADPRGGRPGPARRPPPQSAQAGQHEAQPRDDLGHARRALQPAGRPGRSLSQLALRSGQRSEQVRHRRLVRFGRGPADPLGPQDAGRVRRHLSGTRSPRSEDHGRGPHRRAGDQGARSPQQISQQLGPSASRAVAVVDCLRDAGLPENRMGIAGFAQYQPISPNDTAQARKRNRRVEIFVVGPETPVVGWTETLESVYR